MILTIEAILAVTATLLLTSLISALHYRNRLHKLSELEQSQAELLGQFQLEQATSAVRLEERQQEIKFLQQQLEQLNQAKEIAIANQHQAETNFAKISAQLVEKEASFAQQKRDFEQSKQQLKVEFQHLATEILEQKSRSFKETNQASMDQLLQPFKVQMDQFRQKVEQVHLADVRQQAELKTEMQHLKALNQQITQEAHELANALKGQKKMQGNWGELVLENVLERSGLQAGKDYKTQNAVHSESGAIQYPDAVIYLPQNKHLIIDSKVSLNAYTRYVNAETEIERQVALKEHTEAFAARIKELADKKYPSAQELNSPEIVFMFVPIESAFVDALRFDETLFQKAIEQNILVATPTTLLTSLNIVRQLWRFEEQSKHTAELVKRADGVYQKLRVFLGSFMNIKKAIDKAGDEFIRAESQLVSGKGNLIKRAEEFKTFAPSIQGSLPPELVEKSSLEVDHSYTGQSGAQLTESDHETEIT